MADIIRFNVTTGQVLEYRRSVNTPDFEGLPDVLINPVVPANVAVADMKVVSGVVVELSPAEKAARNTASSAAALASLKVTAKEYVNTRPDDIGLVLRAVVKIMLTEINLLRTNAGLATRTATQLRNAIEAELDLTV